MHFIRLSRTLVAGALACGLSPALAVHTENVLVEGTRLHDTLTVPSLAGAREALDRVAGGSGVVDPESYRTGRVGTLQDALGMSAGVFIQPRFGAEEARLSIRGSGVQRTFHLRGVQLLQDGVPLNQADGGGDFQALDPLAAQYIEVYRGANALRYGATTLGGAINFVSPTGRSARPVETRAEYGSFDYKRLQVSAAGERGVADYYLNLGYSAQDGFRAHARQENYRLSGNTGFSLRDDLETRFYVYLADSDSELPGNLTRAQLRTRPGQANPVNVLGDNKRDFFLWRVANRTVYDMGTARLEFSAFFTYKDLFHPIFQVLDVVSQDYGMDIRLVSDAALFGRRNLFTAGFMPLWGDIDDDRFANVRGRRGARRNQMEQHATNYALYAENQHYAAPRLALVTGIQLTRAERELDDLFLADGNASFDIGFDAVSPKLGLRYEFDDNIQLFTNVSRSFEPPSFGELSGAQLLNVLGDQSATTFEVGSRGAHAGLKTHWDVAYYVAWVKDEFLSLTDAQGQPLGTISADATIHQGLELALETKLFDRVLVRQSYLWSDLRFDDDRVFGDNALAGMPEHLYRAEFLYQWPAGYYAGPTLEWAPSDTPVDHANTLFADDYVLVGFRAGYRTPRGFGWFVDLRNLTDAAYAASTGVVADAAGRDAAQFLPGDGLGMFAGVEWRF